jgi:amino acid transporter
MGSELEAMSRNLYILAATLVFFAVICFGMMAVPTGAMPGLPENGTLWKSMGLLLLLGGLLVALLGVLTALADQVDRRSEERRRREGQRGNR